MDQTLPSPGRFLLLAALAEGGMGVAAFLLGLVLGIPFAELVQVTPSALALGFLVTVPMLLGFLACLRWPVGPVRSIMTVTETIIIPMFARSTLLDLALISILAGIGEEMLFRGLLQTYLTTWLGPLGANLAASVLFGLVHPMTASYAVLATLIGLYLGWVFQETGNLVVVMTAHALYDFVALVVLTRTWRPEKAEP